MTDEERIDGTELAEPDEPGSDLLLDEDVREVIAGVMRNDGLEPRIPDPRDAPAPIREAVEAAHKRRDEAQDREDDEAHAQTIRDATEQAWRDHPEADPTATDPDED